MSIQLTYILLIENVKPFRDDEDDRLNLFTSELQVFLSPRIQYQAYINYEGNGYH